MARAQAVKESSEVLALLPLMFAVLASQARDAGNIMMDSPRFNGKLAKALEERGGLSYMIISHIDDVADHQRYFPHEQNVVLS